MKDLLKFGHYIKPHKYIFIFALICGIIFGIMSGFGIPVIFECVFRKFFEDKDLAYSTQAIIGTALLVPLSFSIRGVFGFLNSYYMSYCGMLILKSLRYAIFQKIQQLELSFFDKNTQGDLLSRINSDPSNIQTAILELASEAFRQPIQILSALIGLGYLSFKNNNFIFLFIFVVATPLCLIPVRIVRKHLKARSRQTQDASGKLYQSIHENLSAILDIRSYTLEEQQQSKFINAINQYNNFELKLIQYQKIQQPLMELISAFLIAGIFAYSYYTKIPFSTFSAMGLGFYFAIDPLKRLGNTINIVHKAHGAIQRVNEILQEPIRIQNPIHPLKIESLKGNIEFEKISFQYASENNSNPVLNNISVSIPAKTKCALVGPSGSGKTTFSKLIPRFYDPSSGTIRIDGHNIQDIDLNFLRKHIAIVSQHPTLFNDTVYNNILLGNPSSTKDEVIQAAHHAFANEFIEDMELGYETIIGDRGDRLSGGQKQRISIARAFLKNAPILILDEATSALDAQSEYYIQQAIQQLSKDKTVIIIAHRLSTVQNCNKILVFNHGKIVAEGTHSELLESSPLYKDLVEKQSL